MKIVQSRKRFLKVFSNIFFFFSYKTQKILNWSTKFKVLPFYDFFVKAKISKIFIFKAIFVEILLLFIFLHWFLLYFFNFVEVFFLSKYVSFYHWQLQGSSSNIFRVVTMSEKSGNFTNWILWPAWFCFV